MSEIPSFDVAIIGAGVVGSAIAMRLASSPHPLDLIVIEAGPRVGEGITSRNSGVIHAGIYYPPGSLKAETCIHGKNLLYKWLSKNSVPYKKTGKLIVATAPDQQEALHALYKNALSSGATGLKLITSDEVKKLEPNLPHALEAIFSEETGIVDQYELTKSFYLDAEEKDCTFIFNQPVKKIEKSQSGYLIQTADEQIQTQMIINCAGLAADEIATLLGVEKYKIYPCRGDYFTLKAPTGKYQHLIYPVKNPKEAGLGVHLTIDTSGRFKLGPDAQYVNSKTDFAPAENKKEAFWKAAQKLLGPLELNQLDYDTCGIRPKLRSPQDPAEKDFILSQDLPGLINCIGIESPGLTASLAIAERVEKLLFSK